jgi:hypothetical protein
MARIVIPCRHGRFAGVFAKLEACPYPSLSTVRVLKFRRQHQAGECIVDFVSLKRRLLSVQCWTAFRAGKKENDGNLDKWLEGVKGPTPIAEEALSLKVEGRIDCP